jgi:hypothetical protein
VPQFPADALEDRVRSGNWAKLELGRWRKPEALEAFVGLYLLLRIVLPLDVALPAIPLFLDVEIWIVMLVSLEQLELAGLRDLR